MSGYTDCACRDCFNIAIATAYGSLCIPCEESGCIPAHIEGALSGECLAEQWADAQEME